MMVRVPRPFVERTLTRTSHQRIYPARIFGDAADAAEGA